MSCSDRRIPEGVCLVETERDRHCCGRATVTRPRPWRGRNCMRTAVWSTWLVLVARQPLVARGHTALTVPSRATRSPACVRGDDSRRPTPVGRAASAPVGWAKVQRLRGQASSAPVGHTKGIVRSVAFGVASNWNAESPLSTWTLAPPTSPQARYALGHITYKGGRRSECNHKIRNLVQALTPMSLRQASVCCKTTEVCTFEGRMVTTDSG
jgi:hypothetical protein